MLTYKDILPTISFLLLDKITGRITIDQKIALPFNKIQYLVAQGFTLTTTNNVVHRVNGVVYDGLIITNERG